MMTSDIKGPSPECQVINISLPLVRILPAVSNFDITSSVTAWAGAVERYSPAIGHGAALRAGNHGKLGVWLSRRSTRGPLPLNHPGTLGNPRGQPL